MNIKVLIDVENANSVRAFCCDEQGDDMVELLIRNLDTDEVTRYCPPINKSVVRTALKECKKQ